MRTIVDDKITYLINDGRTMIKRDEPQPHSTLYHFDCGCIVHGEFNLDRKKEESAYRHWIVACKSHKELEAGNLSFKALYIKMMQETSITAG